MNGWRRMGSRSWRGGKMREGKVKIEGRERSMKEPENVQAIINNVSFPKSLDILRKELGDKGEFDIELLKEAEIVDWTVPKWVVEGDIVFFYHAVTAIQSITRMKTELRANPSMADGEEINELLRRGRALYHLYGGKIFAVGRVVERPYTDDWEQQADMHWNSRIYAEISDLYFFKTPLDKENFFNFINISRRSAVTPVFGEDYEKLKEAAAVKNQLPEYVQNSRSVPIPLCRINKDNWIELSREYRRSFFLEMQFRKFYVDFLLPWIGDRKTFYSECACYRGTICTGYADNCIRIKGQLCFVEVKLNVNTEKNLSSQLNRYCHADSVVLEKNGEKQYKNIMQNRMLIIDTESIGIFDSQGDHIITLEKLDNIVSVSDLKQLKEKIYAVL